MPQYVVGLLVAHGNGHHYPVFEGFSDATGANTNVAAYDVGLLKIGVIGVKDNGVGLFYGVAQYLLVKAVPFFRLPEKLTSHGFIAQVVVEGKVRRAQYFKFKSLVVGLVSPKVLCFQRKTNHHQRQGDQTGRSPCHGIHFCYCR